MKIFYKVISIILCITFLFASCVKSTEKSLNTVKQYFAEKKYNECFEYLSNLNKNEFAEIEKDIEILLITEFNTVSQNAKIDFTKLYSLTKYDSTYTETCMKLWNIVSLLTISPDSEKYNTFAYIRFFSESNSFMRFRELYNLMSSVDDNGYISDLHEQLIKYNTNGDYSDFESIYAKAKEFDYAQFDPQEYQIDDFRNAHDKLLKALQSLCNGFATNNTSVIATSINNVYDSLSVILNLTNTLKSIRIIQTTIYETLFEEKSISKNFNTEISISDIKYTISSDFDFELLFSDDKNGFIDSSDIPDITDNISQEIPLKDAISTTISAINQTKQYNNDITVTVIQNINIDMTDFKANTKIDSANEITKSKVNQILDQANGNRQLIKSFSDGISEDGTILYDFIPPQYNSASLNESDVESYSVTKGSGGYVIVFNLKATETKKSSPIASINTIANGFKFDNISTIGDYKTYYSPSSVMFVINNNGLLSKMQYNIDGISDCIFYEKDESVEAEFKFKERYSYTFAY